MPINYLSGREKLLFNFSENISQAVVIIIACYVVGCGFCGCHFAVFSFDFLHDAPYIYIGCRRYLAQFSPRAPLARLCGLDPTPVFLTLDSLRAILEAPKDPRDATNIRLHHPSFRDFLLDPKRCFDSRFSVDEAEAHENLFSNCLNLMSKLQKDICSFQHLGILISAVEKDKVEKSLPLPEIQYACSHWTHHLQRSNTVLCNNDKVHTFLQKHFLHWLEALSLIGVLSEGVHAVFTLESMLTVQLHSFLQTKANSHSRSPPRTSTQARTNLYTMQTDLFLETEG